ncbi:MAG: serine hydrolase domain-containing protein [Vulcanimicrobiaceae bacterium]
MIGTLPDSLDAVVRAGLGQRYTAAVVRVERCGRAVFERTYGALDDAPGARPALPRTAFDLASLTKVFVATAALAAVADGALRLDAPLVDVLPEWRATAHASITLAMLLAHTAGLQSGADYRTLLSDDVERFARERALVARPGERVVYSDLGFIVLGTALARARGRSLANVLAATARRLGCEATAYRSRNDDAAAIPATEFDAWRGRLRGAVHDEKAYLMHGVAGHAGLFGTAHDVCRLADGYLAAAAGRAQPAGLPRGLALAAIAEHGADPVLRRGYGWALKTSDANSCGAAMAEGTFGHTGFTGTCVWADPTRDLAVVLLTNAVYFGRHDLRDVRAAACTAAVAEFGAVR